MRYHSLPHHPDAKLRFYRARWEAFTFGLWKWWMVGITTPLILKVCRLTWWTWEQAAFYSGAVTLFASAVLALSWTFYVCSVGWFNTCKKIALWRSKRRTA